MADVVAFDLPGSADLAADFRVDGPNMVAK